jgi:hypothetical protein
MSHSLILRKRADGRRTLESDLPDEHTFSARWIQKELGDLARVTVTLVTEDGEVDYVMESYEPIVGPLGRQVRDEQGDLRWNWTGLVCRRVERPKRGLIERIRGG